MPLAIPLPSWLCNHPASFIHVRKDATVERQPSHPDDDEGWGWNHVTYHLYCLRCGKDVSLTYAQSYAQSFKRPGHADR